ncbi:MAG: cysteine desulfurase [Actinobacteria bacterium]|nr:cysteine desulfurase [Actinomycetota bacterium]
MAITTASALDARALRADFPIFERGPQGAALAYLDSSNSSQKPYAVLEAMQQFYETSYSNVHRGVYELGERAAAGYEGAREKVRAFLNAASTREIVFTRNATEALNLVAYAWGLENLVAGDVVVVTELEHHSNFVPWQFVARRRGAEFVAVPVDENQELDLSSLDDLARRGRVKVVAVGHVNNSVGTVNPVGELAAWAHEQGAICVVDACQAVPHRTLDVRSLGADFVACTGHKMLGPTGIGVLWGRQDLLQRMQPFNLGGGMIRKVSLEETTWGDLPHKFEAGTPPFVEAVGLGAAIDYLGAVGLENVERHETELTEYALGRLGEVNGLRVFGPTEIERRAGIVSFDLEDVHPHDVAQILGGQGVAVRAGHHCTQPLMRKLGVAATTRASFYLYTVPEEIDRLVEGLQRVKQVFA